MRELHIDIRNKIATYSTRGGAIVCGNNDYTIRFSFDSEWEEYKSKTVRFIWNDKYIDVVILGDTVPVPMLSQVTELTVGVYAGEKLYTTTPAKIPCLLSVLCESDRAKEADYYEVNGTLEYRLPVITPEDDAKILQAVNGVYELREAPDLTMNSEVVNEVLHNKVKPVEEIARQNQANLELLNALIIDSLPDGGMENAGAMLATNAKTIIEAINELNEGVTIIPAYRDEYGNWWEGIDDAGKFVGEIVISTLLGGKKNIALWDISLFTIKAEDGIEMIEFTRESLRFIWDFIPESVQNKIKEWADESAIKAIEDVEKWVDETGKEIENWAKETAQPVIEDIETWIDETGKPAIEEVQTWIEEVAKPAIEETKTWVEETGEDIQQWIDETGKPAIEEVQDWVDNTAKPAIEEFQEWVEETAKPAIEETLTDVQDWVDNTAKPAITEFQEWIDNTAKPAIDTTLIEVQAKADEAAEWLNGIGTDIQEWVDGADEHASAFKDKVEGVIADTKTELNTNINNAKDTLNENIDNAKTELNTNLEKAKDTLSENIDNAKIELNNNLEQAKAELNEIIENLKKVLENLGEDTSEFAIKVINNLKNLFVQNDSEGIAENVNIKALIESQIWTALNTGDKTVIGAINELCESLGDMGYTWILNDITLKVSEDEPLIYNFNFWCNGVKYNRIKYYCYNNEEVGRYEYHLIYQNVAADGGLWESKIAYTYIDGVSYWSGEAYKTITTNDTISLDDIATQSNSSDVTIDNVTQLALFGEGVTEVSVNSSGLGFGGDSFVSFNGDERPIPDTSIYLPLVAGNSIEFYKNNDTNTITIDAVVDSDLNPLSKRPIQNKVVTECINELYEKIGNGGSGGIGLGEAIHFNFASGVTEYVEVNEGGISWSNDETEIETSNGDFLYPSSSNSVPIVAGDNIEFEVDAEKQIVKINSIDGGSSITVDETLDSTSTNPVQNKVIVEALNGKVSCFTLSTSPSTTVIDMINTIKNAGGNVSDWNIINLTGYTTATFGLAMANYGGSVYFIQGIDLANMKVVSNTRSWDGVSLGTLQTMFFEYQPKTDEDLTTDDKTIVGAINEVNGKTVDKISYIDTYFSGEHSVSYDADYGISWEDEFELGNNDGALAIGEIYHRIPIVAGTGIEFTRNTNGTNITIDAVVDSDLNSLSKNPIQNKVVAEELVDIREALNEKLPKSGGTLTGNLVVTNNSSKQADEPSFKWKTVNTNTPYVGFATDQTDGTFVFGSLKGTNYASGLAIGGGSGNLLWKGAKVVTATDLGAAATKGVATSVTSGNTNLVTSGAVYTAITNAITTALNTGV